MPTQRPTLIALAASLALAGHHAAAQQAPTVTEAPLRAHLSFLADDLLEGRGTGQRGGAIAVRYLEAQAAAIGLKPANGNSYRQAVRMVGEKTEPGSAISFDVGGKTLTPQFGAD